MNPEQLREHADLTEAVNALIVEVRGLNDRLAFYSPREEVRKDGRKRAWRFFASAMGAVLVAQALTMSTISYCFLDASATYHPACSIMPGYTESYEQNQIRLARFNLLLEQIDVNRQDIKRQDLEIEVLKQQQKKLLED